MPKRPKNLEHPAFNVRRLLRECTREYRALGQSNNPRSFKNVLLVGMQHILGTTLDMLVVMKTPSMTNAARRSTNWN